VRYARRVIEAHVYRNGEAQDGPVDLTAANAMLAEDGAFIWLDVVEPTEDEVEDVGRTLGLHALTLEDVVHRRQRPKVELFEGYAFVAVRPFTVGPAGEVFEGELHAVVGRRFLATMRFGPHPFGMEDTRRRWGRQEEVLHREGGAFAAYILLDEVVDDYLSLIERMEDQADLLEDDVFAEADAEADGVVQERIFRLKRDVVRLRRFVSPLRQGLDLLQEEPSLAGSQLQPYYRDLTEHVIRVAELADNIRDILTSLLEVRVGQVANHLNEIMKKLSAWAGIILVPTLIAGIYGMNFRDMPELRWVAGYPVAIGLMGASALTLYVLFKRKGWL
jgi:magnesium transporter